MNKEVIIRFRTDNETKQKLKMICEKKNITMSTFLRDLIQLEYKNLIQEEYKKEFETKENVSE